MRAFAAIVVLGSGLASCANNRDLETKVDQLSAQLVASQNAQKELERRVDDLTAKVKEQPAEPLESKIHDLEKKIDMIGAARPPTPPRAPRPEPDRAKVYAVLPTGVAVVGKDDAKVTLVWAYDYACPYCERVRSTIEDLEKKYGKDLRVVHKAFVVHPQVATAGALAACAATKQKKFAAIDSLLWEKGFKGRQFDKDVGTDKCWDAPEGCAVVLGYAKEAKLDTKRFQADMKSCQADIQDQMKELQKFGVGATPSFFINGRFLSGAMPIESFATLIDEELGKANERVKQGTPAAKYYEQWVMEKGEKSLTIPTP